MCHKAGCRLAAVCFVIWKEIMSVYTCRSRGLWILVFLTVVFVLGAGSAGRGLADPTKPGDCAACHGDESVLPEGHVPTADMDTEGCLACHGKATPLTLRSKMPLSHFHSLSGVTCQDCHGENETPQALSTEQCLICHGTLEDLAARTSDSKPENPHSTPHGPTYVACDLCHKQHAKSENFCFECHDFEFVVP